MSIANRISDLIDEKEITQKKLATALNVAPSTINGYITKGREPDIETLLKLASYFGVSVDYLLDFNMCVSSNGQNEKENELIELYRRLDCHQQVFLLDQIKFMIRCNYKRHI